MTTKADDKNQKMVTVININHVINVKQSFTVYMYSLLSNKPAQHTVGKSQQKNSTIINVSK